MFLADTRAHDIMRWQGDVAARYTSADGTLQQLYLVQFGNAKREQRRARSSSRSCKGRSIRTFPSTRFSSSCRPSRRARLAPAHGWATSRLR